MIGNYHNRLNSNQIFSIGLFLFSILNVFTAGFMDVHFDEAYYWVYSKNPSLGYFDHPPMIAWMIFAGQTLFDNELGLRLFTIIFSTITVWILWILAKKYTNNALLFWAIIYSTLLVHPYSFIATPDGPLFLFTAIFFLIYDRYLKNNSWGNSLTLGVSIALMLYSKYHGVLVVGFVTLSNLKLLSKKSFWVVALTSFLLIIPHFWWQYQNHFLSFQYHLIDRYLYRYEFKLTLFYILSELAVTGPWLGWFFLYALWKNKPINKYELGLKVMGIGVFVFFLLSTFGGDYEAHWTLIAFVPLILLTIKFVEEHQKWQKWIYISGIVNFCLLLVVRVLLVTPLGNDIKAMSLLKGWKTDCFELKSKVGDTPVLFQDSWNRAARYAYYTKDTTVGNLNSGLYRRNQFDLLDLDEKLSGQTVYVISTDSTQFDSSEKLITKKAVWYVKKIESFHSYYNLKLKTGAPFRYENDRLICPVVLENPYPNEIHLRETAFELYRHEGQNWVLIATDKRDSITIGSAEIMEDVAIFNLSRKEFENDEIYLTFKIGVLKPIPGRILIHKATFQH